MSLSLTAQGEGKVLDKRKKMSLKLEGRLGPNQRKHGNRERTGGGIALIALVFSLEWKSSVHWMFSSLL